MDKISSTSNSLADLGGVPGARHPLPPLESRFFRFDKQNFRNVIASGVGVPYEVHTSLREILDPPL